MLTTRRCRLRRWLAEHLDEVGTVDTVAAAAELTANSPVEFVAVIS